MLESFADKFATALQNIFLGWIPQWLWDLIGWWPWILGALGASIAVGTLYRIYKVGGWPALVVAVGALGTAVGYVLGKRDTKPPVAPPEPPKPVKKTKKHRVTIFDPDGDGKIG